MNILFALLMLANAGLVHAATYAVIPDAQTGPVCQKLGFTGEFRLRASGTKSWTISFASGSERVVRKKSKGVYHSIVSCTMGCTGYAEVRLNLNTKEFYYWNSIDRRPQECRAAVVVK